MFALAYVLGPASRLSFGILIGVGVANVLFAVYQVLNEVADKLKK